MLMKVVKLKTSGNTFLALKRQISDCSQVLQSCTPEKKGYSFYRGRIFETDQPYVVGIQLLCSNEDGNFSVQTLVFDMTKMALYYPTGMSVFEHEDKVKKSIKNLIRVLMDIPHSINELYFDFVASDMNKVNIVACYMIKDAKNPDGWIAFATVGRDFHYKYNLVEAKNLCSGSALSSCWTDIFVELASRVNAGKIAKDTAIEKMRTMGIEWVD